MSYGVKYTCTHKEETNGNETTYTIEILGNGYSGAVTEVKGMSDIFKLDYEEIDPNDLSGSLIQKGYLEFYLGCGGTLSYNGLAILQELDAAQEDDFRMRLKIDGAIYWTGSVLSDFIEYPENDYVFHGTIVAKDLTYLTGVQYSLTDDRVTLITTLAGFLNSLGLGLDIYTYTSWITNDTTDSDDFLNQIYNERKGFRTYARTGDESDETITVQEALDRFLFNYGLVLRQSGNAWRVYQLSALSNPASVNQFRYNSSGVQQSNGTVDLRQTVDKDERFILPGTTNKGVSALKKIYGKFAHRTKISGITFPNSLILLGTDSDSYSQFFQSSGNQKIILGLKVLVESTADETESSATIQIRAGSYYWNGTAWTTTSSNYSFNLTGGGVANGEGNYIYTGFASITTDLIPSAADGTLLITFNPGTVGDPPTYPESTIYSNLSFEIDNPVAIENSDSVDYVLSQPNVFSSVQEYPNTYFGDGPTGYAISALRYGSGDSDLTSESWQRRGTASGYRNLHENLFKEFLDFRRARTRNLYATLFGEFDCGNVLVYDSTNFFFFGGSINGRSEWVGNFLTLSLSTATDTFENILKFEGEGSSGTGSGTSSGSGGIDQPTADLRYLQRANNLSDGTASVMRSNLGLGSLAVRNNVNNNDWSGADLAIVNGGTGASSASAARTNLGLVIGTDVQAYSAFLDSVNQGLGTGDDVAHRTLILSHSSFPVGKMERTTTLTGGSLSTLSGIASAVMLKTTTSNDMIDGFGGGFVFVLNDDTVTSDSNIAARFYVRRDGADNAGLFQFLVNNNDIAMTMRASGNIGIGDTSPSFKLDVNGTGRFTGDVDLDTNLDVLGTTTLDVLDVADGATFADLIIFDSDLKTDDFALGTGSTGWLTDGGAGAGVIDEGSVKSLYVDNITVRQNARFFRLIVKNIDVIGGTEIMSVANGEAAEIKGTYDGTITSFVGSSIITGSGTSFLTDISVNDVIYGLSNGVISEIGTAAIINSDTSISVAGGVSMATTSGIYFVNSLRERVVFDDPSGGNITSLAADDLTATQQFDINNPSSLVKSEWRTVASKTANTVQFETTTGAPAPSSVLDVGDLVVQYGNETDTDRQSIIYRNVEGTPIVRLQTGINTYAKFATTPATTTNYAYGDMNGLVTGISSAEYGQILGDPTLAGNHVLLTDSQASLKLDTFNLEAGNLNIDSEGTTYPGVSTGDTSTDFSGGDFVSSSLTFLDLSISDGKWVKFQFDYNQDTNGTSNFQADFEVQVQGDSGGGFGAITSSDTILYLLSSTYAFVDNSTGPILTVTNTSDNSKVALRFQSSTSIDNDYDGTITFYMYIFDKGNIDDVRLRFENLAGVISDSDATQLSGTVYNPKTSVNPGGIFIRLSDALISTNGVTGFYESLIT